MNGAVTVVSVKSGPAGLVVVELRLPNGKVRRLVMGSRTMGVAEVEWAAQAVAMLAELGEV